MPGSKDDQPRSPQLRSPTDALAPGSARSLLFTILGELVWPEGGPVRTTTLVRALGRFEIEEQTGRQAIARAAASGWITSVKEGREVLWSLTPKLVEIFQTGSRRVYALSEAFESWDGTWLTVVINVPQERRAARRPLYAGLTWAGLGNPAPGLWLTPHAERIEEVRELLDSLGLRGQALAMIGAVADRAGINEADIVARGWDLEALRERYLEVAASLDGPDPESDADTLVAHVTMLSQWRDFPRADPQLPDALLPDWVGRRVAREIEARRAQWRPAAKRAFAALDASQ